MLVHLYPTHTHTHTHTHPLQAKGLHFKHTDNFNYWLRSLSHVGLPKVCAKAVLIDCVLVGLISFSLALSFSHWNVAQQAFEYSLFSSKSNRMHLLLDNMLESSFHLKGVCILHDLLQISWDIERTFLEQKAPTWSPIRFSQGNYCSTVSVPVAISLQVGNMCLV